MKKIKNLLKKTVVPAFLVVFCMTFMAVPVYAASDYYKSTLAFQGEYGGKSIAVYNPNLNEPSSTAIQLVNEARADFMSKADYRENKDMENLLKQILRMMADTAVLEDIEGKIR